MIKVFIVDDHQLVIEGIISFLQKEKNMQVAGYATTAMACLDYFKTNTADVILMDINLPDMNGMDLCKLIKTNYTGISVIALSTNSQGSYITQIIENGASGYLLKNADKEEIIEAILSVENGKTYFSFEAGRIYKATTEKKSGLPVLSKREKEILKLIAEGFTNSEISKKLFISIDTVDTHRKNLYTKLNVKNTALLIRQAIENNYL
ncbi:MAG: response regulator transcription factor [Chitinophagaceae bacterium]|nr:response regulator transcription factor [Chitinophagaceae bacterium]